MSAQCRVRAALLSAACWAAAAACAAAGHQLPILSDTNSANLSSLVPIFNTSTLSRNLPWNHANLSIALDPNRPYRVYISDGHSAIWEVPDFSVQSTNSTLKLYAGLPGVQATKDGPRIAEEGTPQALFNSPAAICVDRNTGNVLVAEATTVRLISARTGQVSTVAGSADEQGDRDGTSALFQNAVSLVCLPNGDVLVADSSLASLRYLVCIENCPRSEETRSQLSIVIALCGLFLGGILAVVWLIVIRTSVDSIASGALPSGQEQYPYNSARQMSQDVRAPLLPSSGTQASFTGSTTHQPVTRSSSGTTHEIDIQAPIQQSSPKPMPGFSPRATSPWAGLPRTLAPVILSPSYRVPSASPGAASLDVQHKLWQPMGSTPGEDLGVQPGSSQPGPVPKS